VFGFEIKVFRHTSYIFTVRWAWE